ncbi:hypothetical protein, variant 2 [Exophiala mesophila]|nr:hypothetical protein, variant 2 [Exophiala mesophila]KIV97504.1 hypothetical protein, variant 2 [Exophiala mesophila]
MSSAEDQYYRVPYFDPERDFLGPERAVSLEPVQPTYEPEESPRPPLVRYDTSSSSGESEGEGNTVPPRGSKNIRGRTAPSICGAALIPSLALSQPQNPLAAGKHALESRIVSGAEEGEEDREGVADQGEGQQFTSVDGQMRHCVYPIDSTASTVETEAETGVVHSVDPRRRHSYHDGSNLPLAADRSRHHHGTKDGNHELSNREGSRTSHDTTRPRHGWQTLPPLSSIRGPGNAPLDLDGSSEREGSLVSPTLSKFAISPRDVDRDSLITLPALQRSPPPTSQPRSPETKQTLPPITNLIDSSSGLHSPLLSRNSPGRSSQTPTSYAPSPHPGMSPPAPPVHFNFRSSTRDSSISGTSEYNSSTSTAGSNSASSLVAQSPAASYTSTLSILPERDLLPRPDDLTGLTLSDPTKTVPSSDSNSTNSYVCTHKGCTAQPFQTQYLLNSHMNVHSDARPHFCPLDDCARGRNGEGFKRKNEMIR